MFTHYLDGDSRRQSVNVSTKGRTLTTRLRTAGGMSRIKQTVHSKLRVGAWRIFHSYPRSCEEIRYHTWNDYDVWSHVNIFRKQTTHRLNTNAVQPRPQFSLTISHGSSENLSATFPSGSKVLIISPKAHFKATRSGSSSQYLNYEAFVDIYEQQNTRARS